MRLTSTRKIAFVFIVLISAFHFSFSQCVIDTNNFQLIYPNTSDLPCIERNVPYSTTLQFFAPPTFGGFTIDSILLTTFLNLPTGITYAVNPMPCKLYPFGHGCVLISGTTTDTVGDYPIDYNGTIYLPQGPPTFDYIRANFPGALPDYDLIVVQQGDACADTTTGIRKLGGNAKIDFSVYPNPTSGVFELKTGNTYFSHAEINITDALGRMVYSQKSDNIFTGTTRIDLSAFPKGLYLVQLRSAEGAASKNISIE